MALSFKTQTLATFLASSPTTPSKAMTASLISQSFNINQSDTFAMQFIWSGTPTGTLTVMGSLDGVNYNVPLMTHAAGGAAGVFTFDLAAYTCPGLTTSCGYVRGEYTFTSGTGTLSLVQVCSKYTT